MKESSSLQETPLCGSSEELPVEMDRGETRAALGQTRQHQRVLQSRQQAGAASYPLCTASRVEQNEVLAEHPKQQPPPSLFL